MAPNWSERLHSQLIWPNLYKFIQISANCFNWLKLASNGSKWLQMTLNCSKWQWLLLILLLLLLILFGPFFKISQLLADEGLTLEYWSETLTFRRFTVYDDWRFELVRCFLFIQHFVSVWYSVWVQCWAIVQCFELLQCPPPPPI